MNTFTARWLRKVVKNQVLPSLLWYAIFKTSVDAHFNRMAARRTAQIQPSRQLTGPCDCVNAPEGLPSCRWCGSTEHNDRTHDDAQY